MSRPLTALAAAGAVLAAFGAPEAKTPGHEYCFNGVCHRVKSLEETRRLVGVATTLKASYYDAAGHDSYNPSNLTSSGEYFRPSRPDNAASPIYPDGTKLLVWHPASGKALVVRVNNAGPYWGDRKLDLSRAAAERFGFTGRGVATVKVQVLEAPTPAEATYRKGRVYAPVQGYLGQFASLDAALTGADGGTTRLASAPLPPAAMTSKSVEAPQMVVTTTPEVAVASVSIETRTPVPLTLLDVKLARLASVEARKYIEGSAARLQVASLR